MANKDAYIEEGYDKRINQGVTNEKYEITKNLLNNDINLDIISNCTGFSKEQIKELK